jgi:ferric-dicitrate binding protein FerR (iron transport regulator)
MELEKVFSKDYTGFTANDFLAEESFVTWVKHRGENHNLDLYWEMIQEKYPELDVEIENAIRMSKILADYKIYTGGKEPAEAWKSVKKRIVLSGPFNILSLTGQFIIKHRNIAAVIISIVMIAGAALGGYLVRPVSEIKDALTTVYSPAGQRTEITLPDHSKVLLNSKTTLTYSSGFNSINREIYLDGEAYFDVKKGCLPFEVRTEAMNIRVLGTAFNVKCYSDESVFEATLVRGSMIVEKIDPESGIDEEILLKPNQKVVFERGKAVSVAVSGAEAKSEESPAGVVSGKKEREAGKLNLIESYDTKKSTGWIDGLLIIEGETLEDLSKKIERRYDVSIVFMSEKLRKFKYTGTLREYSLEQVLQALEATSPISYRVDKHMVYIGENKEEINKYMKLMN